MTPRDLGEFGLIEHLAARLKQRGGVRLGIGDDAALLDALAFPVVTTDALLEGVHFRRDWTSPRALGNKAMTVNVSDIAAMGGRPVAAFVALAAGPNDDLRFLEELYAGFEAAAALYNFTVAGGDTVRSRGDLMLSITLVGEAPRPITRSGAQVGDVLLVTGTLGDAGAALQLLLRPEIKVESAAREFLLGRHHQPTARLAEMRAALKNDGGAIHAALDLSDGPAGDAAHIARRSGVSLGIEAEKLPISAHCFAAARALGVEALDLALAGGEDYEILFAVAPEEAGTPVSAIGHCAQAGERAVLVWHAGREKNAPRGFTHF